MSVTRQTSRRFGRGLIFVVLIAMTLVGWSQRPWSRGEVEFRGGVPEWERDEELPNDQFTFARIQYDSWGGSGWRGRGKWSVDWPESDLNMSFRLQQLTALKVDPEGTVLNLTEDRLFEYPFIYIIEPGELYFSSEEVGALRKYLLTGGFLMVDDFWGENEWANFAREMKRVFPTREIVELPIEHEIFQCVFPLKEKPQVPNPRTAMEGAPHGITWERWDAETPHYRGIYDDDGRLMVVICHNTDLGDGWEEESRAGQWYFKEFSEPKAYPMGINIIFYSMTH
ncbi:MAG: transmembrane prediction [Verrucomicrobiales bacterium]|nr:transmembrane prediction [Verrucomicrobiales bacterium]|tara:strand:- start:2388 stop:3236 length:849 start_codon:yes stop_codon:yes gene_type:complete